MNIVYLQADLRYNNWLLKKIKDKYVLEYTLDKIRSLDVYKVVAGIYNCEKNKLLIEILEGGGGRCSIVGR